MGTVNERGRADVVVVGGGPAGWSTALLLRRTGLDVVLVEKGSREPSARGWEAVVPEWMFEQAGIDSPRGEEVVGYTTSFSFGGRWGRPAQRVRTEGLATVDVDRLTGRLARQAIEAGVELVEHARVVAVTEEAGRPRAVTAEHAQADWIEIEADLFVDATGVRGALRRRVEAMVQRCPEPGPGDLCHAAQQIRAVGFKPHAVDYLRMIGIEPGESVTWTGMAGGFSTLTVRVEEDFEKVGILAGSIAGLGHPTGQKMLETFLEHEGWVGHELSGGRGVIPVRGPYFTQAMAGIALTGDAGCQVFPAHGSGIGNGMLAARLLADAVTGHSDPGCAPAMWDYQVSFHRTVGCVCAAYDVFRRTLDMLDGDQMDRLVHSGIVSEGLMEASMLQRFEPPPLSEIPLIAARATKMRTLAMAMLPALTRMAGLHALYKGYPAEPDPERIRTWEAHASKLLAR